MAQAAPHPHGPVVPGQQAADTPSLTPFSIDLAHFARPISEAIWGCALGGRRVRTIQSLTLYASVPAIDCRALEHLVHLWRGWKQPTDHEIVAEPWRGRYGRRPFFKKIRKGSAVKVMAFTLIQPR